MYKFKI